MFTASLSVRFRQTSDAFLLVGWQRLHGSRIDWHLHLVAEWRRHQQYAHTGKCVHERQVTETPDTEQSRGDSYLPQSKRNVVERPVNRRIDFEIPHQP